MDDETTTSGAVGVPVHPGGRAADRRHDPAGASALPYGGVSHPNSGHAGGATSQTRAEVQDATGFTTSISTGLLSLLASRGGTGLTWREAGRTMQLHHGAISGALSRLHKIGSIARLTVIRTNCSVYVLPEFIYDRPIIPPGQTTTSVWMREAAAVLTRIAPQGCPFHPVVPMEDCYRCDAVDLVRRYEARR